jgi:hypothetical protein
MGESGMGENRGQVTGLAGDKTNGKRIGNLGFDRREVRSEKAYQDRDESHTGFSHGILSSYRPSKIVQTRPLMLVEC